jgi:hypothetical protein
MTWHKFLAGVASALAVLTTISPSLSFLGPSQHILTTALGVATATTAAVTVAVAHQADKTSQATAAVAAAAQAIGGSLPAGHPALPVLKAVLDAAKSYDQTVAV